MAQIIPFPRRLRLVKINEIRALIGAIDVVGEQGRTARDVCAKLLTFTEIADRIGQQGCPTSLIADASDVLDFAAAILDGYYVEGGTAEEARGHILKLFKSPLVVSVCDTVLAHRVDDASGVIEWPQFRRL